LPLVAYGQSTDTFVAGPLPEGALHHWRVVARDPHGAFQGSTVYYSLDMRDLLIKSGPYIFLAGSGSSVIYTQLTGCRMR